MREKSWNAPSGTLVSEHGDALYFDPDTNEWTFERMGEPSATSNDASNAGGVATGVVEEMQSIAQGLFQAIGRDTLLPAGVNNQRGRERSSSPVPYNSVGLSGSLSTYLGNDRKSVSMSSAPSIYNDHPRSSSFGIGVTTMDNNTSDGTSVDEFYDTVDTSPLPPGNPDFASDYCTLLVILTPIYFILTYSYLFHSIFERIVTNQGHKNVSIPIATSQNPNQWVGSGVGTGPGSGTGVGPGLGVGVGDVQRDVSAIVQLNQTLRIAVCITDAVLFCSMCGPLAIVDRAGEYYYY